MREFELVKFVLKIKNMKNFRWLLLLMGTSLFVIIGFQLYWLNDSYDRETRALEIRSNMMFRETVRRLQSSKLNFNMPESEMAIDKKFRFKIVEGQPLSNSQRKSGDLVAMMNVVRDRMSDTMKKDPGIQEAMYMAFEKRQKTKGNDSTREKRRRDYNFMGDRVHQMMAGIDSLQDSLKIADITTAYKKVMDEEKLMIPFSITRIDNLPDSVRFHFNEVRVGFTNPITYRLELGNTFSFISNKLTIPFLFSLFLIAFTIMAFLMLYRNMIRQHRLAELKNEFISNVTHELKTPIATVAVAIEALKNFNAMNNPERTKEYLDISSNELNRLSLLVDKVLKLSMYENQELELTFEKFDMKELVDEVADSMRLQLEKQNTKLTITTAGDTSLHADRLNMLSVVYNLMDNALKYSKDHASIDVQLLGVNGQVELTVSDTGIGIAPEYTNKVFEKFFRVPNGNTHNAKGYGLGLSYVSHIVEQHKGKVKVESKQGSGSRFVVSIPKQQA